MTEYEVEHNIKPNEAAAKHTTRPDMSTFFSELNYSSSGQGQHAFPEPDHVAASHLLLADAYNSILRSDGSRAQILEPLIEQLLDAANHPGEGLDGVPDSFYDTLERVDKKTLKEADACPICGNAYLEEKHILVVRLPCHKDHMFDMECIQPWLKLHRTCPLDRKIIYEKPRPKPEPKQDEEDGEWDDMFA